MRFYDETLFGDGRAMAENKAADLRSHLGEDAEIRFRTMHNRERQNEHGEYYAYGDLASMWQGMDYDVNNVMTLAHGAGRCQPLAEGKRVHREVESEGSLMQSSAPRNTNNIRHVRGVSLLYKTKPNKRHGREMCKCCGDME